MIHLGAPLARVAMFVRPVDNDFVGARARALMKGQTVRRAVCASHRLRLAHSFARSGLRPLQQLLFRLRNPSNGSGATDRAEAHEPRVLRAEGERLLLASAATRRGVVEGGGGGGAGGPAAHLEGEVTEDTATETTKYRNILMKLVQVWKAFYRLPILMYRVEVRDKI